MKLPEPVWTLARFRRWAAVLVTARGMAAMERDMRLEAADDTAPASSRPRFSTWTEAVDRVSKRVEGAPPVARGYQVKMFCMKSTLMMPMLHWKSWVHDCTTGGRGPPVRPTMAWDWK